MSFEFAFYVRDADKIRTIERDLIHLFEYNRIIRASNILDAVSPYLPPNLKVPMILLFIREGILKQERVSPSIEDCILSLDLKRTREFFSAQYEAALILNEINTCSETPASGIEIVATIPAEKAVGKRILEIGSIDGAIRRLLFSARKTILIVNPFFDIFGAAALSGALLGRAEKGVSIRIIGRELINERGEETENLQPLQWLWDRFNESGLDERLELRDFAKRDPASGRLKYALHSKIVLCDENACYIGSANVTESSLRFNFELGVVLRDEIVHPVSQLVGYLWEASEIVKMR